MLVIKFEMWPGGSEAKRYELGRMFVWNKGNLSETNPNRGDYDFAVMRRGETETPWKGGKVTRSGTITNYPRAAYNMWRLVLRCLLAAFKEESLLAKDYIDPDGNPI